jgi:hypothetical protein
MRRTLGHAQIRPHHQHQLALLVAALEVGRRRVVLVAVLAAVLAARLVRVFGRLLVALCGCREGTAPKQPQRLGLAQHVAGDARDDGARDGDVRGGRLGWFLHCDFRCAFVIWGRIRRV